MFEPDYTETMSMLLDAINRQRNNVLPVEKVGTDIAQFMKSQDELLAARETEKNKNEYREISPISILEQTIKYKQIDGSEKEELDFVYRITEESRNEA